MEKDIRHRRTRRPEPEYIARDPSVRKAVSQRPTPVYESKRAGLEGLGDALQGFVRQAHSTVADAITQGELRRIERENEAQKRQAYLDFYSGRSVDPSLENDLDYMDAYRGLQSERITYDAKNDFDAAYRAAAAEDPLLDFLAFRGQWVRDNLSGFEDETVGAAVMSGFHRLTDPMIATHQEGVARRQLEANRQALTSNIAAAVNAGDVISPARITVWMAEARALDPLNPKAAAPQVIAALQAGVKQNPQMADQVLRALETPGTGVNGKSFSESFPDAYNEFQRRAVADRDMVDTVAEADAVRGFQRQLEDAQNLSDADLATLAVEIARFGHVHGSQSAVRGLEETLAKELDRREKHAYKVGRALGMLDGYEMVEPGELQSNIEVGLKARFGTANLLDDAVPEMDDPNNPTGVADSATEVLLGLQGTAPSIIRSQFSGAMLASEDPEKRMKAYRILSAVAEVRGVEYVENFLSDDASRIFGSVYAQSRYSTEAPSMLFERALQNKAEADGGMTWGDALKDHEKLKTKADVEAEVDRQLREGLGAKLDPEYLSTLPEDDPLRQVAEYGALLLDAILGADPSVFIHPSIQRTVMGQALAYIQEGQLNGMTMEQIIERSISRVVGRLEVIPGMNGTAVVQFDNPLSAFADGPGGVEGRTRFGFDVPNPYRPGETTNTVAVYMKERDELVESGVGTAFGLTDPDEIHVAYHGATRGTGTFAVYQNGGPVAFAAGEEFTIGGNTVTMPDHGQGSERALEMIFGDALPPGFGFVAADTNEGEGWMLAYRPHHEDEPMSVAGREREAQAAVEAAGGVAEPSTEQYPLPSDMPGHLAPGIIAPGMKLQELREMILGAARDTGIVSPSAGVTREPGVKKASILPDLSGESIMGSLREELQRGVVQNGPSSVDSRQTEPDQTYVAELHSFVSASEGGFHERVYDDGIGLMTVGYGFNMEQEGARDQWKAAGVEADFDAVLRGDEVISEEDGRKLYQEGMRWYESVVDTATGGAYLTRNQRIALVSVAYNAPSRVRGAGLAEMIERGDIQGVVNFILYESFNPGHRLRNGLSNRRWKEAKKFLGHLDAARYLPTFESYKAFWEQPRTNAEVSDPDNLPPVNVG